MPTENKIMMPLIDQAKLHKRLVLNVVDGIEEKDEQWKIAPNTNHLCWMAGSLVSIRYAMVNLLGGDVQEPHPDFFANNKGILDRKYPSLTDILQSWDFISGELVDRLSKADTEILEADPVTKAPNATGDRYGEILFMIDREAYVIGQMGLLRKAFGYEAMSYK